MAVELRNGHAEVQVYSQQELVARGYTGVYLENVGRHRFFPVEDLSEVSVHLPFARLQFVDQTTDGILQTRTFRASKVNYQFVKQEDTRAS